MSSAQRGGGGEDAHRDVAAVAMEPGVGGDIGRGQQAGLLGLQDQRQVLVIVTRHLISVHRPASPPQQRTGSGFCCGARLSGDRWRSRVPAVPTRPADAAEPRVSALSAEMSYRWVWLLAGHVGDRIAQAIA
jgi:hypothetical protein